MKYFNLDNRTEIQFQQGNHFPVSVDHLSRKVAFSPFIRNDSSWVAFSRVIGVLIEKKQGGYLCPHSVPGWQLVPPGGQRLFFPAARQFSPGGAIISRSWLDRFFSIMTAMPPCKVGGNGGGRHSFIFLLQPLGGGELPPNPPTPPPLLQKLP
jgi:hypothetical protein